MYCYRYHWRVCLRLSVLYSVPLCPSQKISSLMCSGVMSENQTCSLLGGKQGDLDIAGYHNTQWNRGTVTRTSKDQVIDMYHMMYYITQLVVCIRRLMNHSHAYTRANAPGLRQANCMRAESMDKAITDKIAYKMSNDGQTNSSTRKVKIYMYLICQHQYCFECEASGAKVKEVFETGSQQVHYKNIVVLLCTIPSVSVVRKSWVVRYYMYVWQF